LVLDLPALWTSGAMVQQNLEAGRDYVGMTRQRMFRRAVDFDSSVLSERGSQS